MKKWKVYAALGLVNLIYGGNYGIAKAAMPQYLKPFGFIFTRVLFATILFWLYSSLSSKTEKIRKEDIPRMLLCAFLGVGANQLVFFYGLNLTSPINASLIMTTIPVIVLLASAVMFKEKLGWRKVLGVSLGLSGAALLVMNRQDITLSNNNFLGDLMIMANATFFAFYLVAVKPLMQKYQPQTVVRWIFFFGLFMVLPFGWESFTQVDWKNLPSIAWFSVIYVILCTTFIAYLLNVWALRHVTSSVVGIFIYLQPVFASLIAVSLGQDSLSLEKVAYSLLIFSGVYLVSVKKKTAKKNIIQEKGG